MKVAISGLGYVGLTVVACLTRDGHEVVGVDVNTEKVDEVNAGRSPIAEPGRARVDCRGEDAWPSLCRRGCFQHARL